MCAKANWSFFLAALVINALLGVLYAWSLLLVPLEQFLGVSRATISLVPSLALLCFTTGVLIHDSVIRRVPLDVLAPCVLAFPGLGYLLFWAAPSYTALALGYGVMFGLAGGVGFGLALALARETLTPPRGVIVGLVAATFAGSGMTLAAIGAALGSVEPLPRTFGLIGTCFLCGAATLGVVLRGRRFPIAQSHGHAAVGDTTRTWSFWLLFFGNFSICYAGLLFVSHGTTILLVHGLTLSDAAWAPVLLNLGYLLGALTGGVIAARFPSRFTPMVFCTLSALSVAVFLFDSPALMWVPSMMLIGAAFGGTVSIFMMLLHIWYGASQVGALFGRINISYGIAGLSAPSITGWLFTKHADYNAALVLATVLLLAGSLGFILAKRPPPSSLRPDNDHRFEQGAQELP